MDNVNKIDKETQLIGLRYQVLDLAIKSGSGTSYNDVGLAEINVDKLVEAAKKFEAYLKGIENGN